MSYISTVVKVWIQKMPHDTTYPSTKCKTLAMASLRSCVHTYNHLSIWSPAVEATPKMATAWLRKRQNYGWNIKFVGQQCNILSKQYTHISRHRCKTQYFFCFAFNGKKLRLLGYSIRILHTYIGHRHCTPTLHMDTAHRHCKHSKSTNKFCLNW